MFGTVSNFLMIGHASIDSTLLLLKSLFSQLNMRSLVVGFGLGFGCHAMLMITFQNSKKHRHGPNKNMVKSLSFFKLLNSKEKLRMTNSTPLINDCLLFSPVRSMWNRCYNMRDTYCELPYCSFCNQSKFFKLVGQADCSLDICIYLISSNQIFNLIQKLFEKGVAVRIIVDKQMSFEGRSSKISQFLKEHIPVKVVNTTDLMHNKFVIIDKMILISGSFNYTNQALERNYENAIVTSDEFIVSKFVDYFQCLWINYCT